MVLEVLFKVSGYAPVSGAETGASFSTVSLSSDLETSGEGP
jgi:hypothetical protein